MLTRTTCMPDAPSTTHRTRVMIVDDDSSVLESLGAVFSDSGYDVSLAEDGIFAVDCFLKNRPQVILLDINMPGKNGWQALDAISKIDPLVPMIIITARPNQQGVASGRGVDALMEKPLDFELLLSTVKRLSEQTRSERCQRLTDPTFRTEILKL